LRREVVQADDCVALALETVEPSIRSAQHTLEVERSSVELAINVDKDRLTQCITNLLNNAVKYSPPASRIRVRTFSQDGMAIIEVQDFGHGIRPDVIPHIFDLFAQGHDTLDRRNGGLGIGLSVCKRLIEMHGGAVTAQSAGEGKGATFTLKVPLAPTPPRGVNPTPTSRTAMKRVLIVDDNCDAADTVSMLLELAGHQTKVVFQGEDALKSWKAYQADVVILDIGLPDLSGYEVVARLRQEGFSGVAIALSGYGQPEDRRRALDSGFDLHFVKPVDSDALEKALAGV
jgi:CheY-like chemotaxis protein